MQGSDNMVLYHGMRCNSPATEVRKQGTPKIFHGDSIALTTTNKPLAGQKKAGLVVLSTCLNIQNLPC